MNGADYARPPTIKASLSSLRCINIHGGLVVDVLHIHLITYDISLNIFSLAQYERFQDTWRNRGNSPPPWSNLPAISIEHLGDDTRHCSQCPRTTGRTTTRFFLIQ
ncbi:hypothetical protein LENED_005992 [Lentinula edodes]|uniref:Uncharacterized protein n=1 Tax=Lentinula edodes TaxID=5353 RepID=A0A1Q3EAF8_LENED|nr:hypothetical protein LENED_005992 [Lentinula edodes]